MNKYKYLIIALAICAVTISCEKEPDPQPVCWTCVEQITYILEDGSELSGNDGEPIELCCDRSESDDLLICGELQASETIEESGTFTIPVYWKTDSMMTFQGTKRSFFNCKNDL